MIDPKYDLTIEATEDTAFFSFFSTELEGFAGVALRGTEGRTRPSQTYCRGGVVREKGSIRFYNKVGCPRPIRVDDHGGKRALGNLPCDPESRGFEDVIL